MARKKIEEEIRKKTMKEVLRYKKRRNGRRGSERERGREEEGGRKRETEIAIERESYEGTDYIRMFYIDFP